MNCEIVCTRGPMKGRRWGITPRGLKIGRDESCEIQVKDLSAELFHCTVKLADGKPVVLNLASTKGVEVNGAYVSEASLKPADSISIGNEKFELVATDGGKGGSRRKVPIAPIVVMLIAVVAVGVTFLMRTKSAKRSVAVEPKTVPAETLATKEKPAEDAITTNRVVRIVNEEVVTTNRIVRIVDNVVVTNYVVEVRRNGEIVSSTALPEQAEPEKPVAVKEVAPAESEKQVAKQEPKPESKDKEPEVVLPPYEVIDSKKALALGGASGGDEVRMVVNTNGTTDIIHIFTEESKAKTLVVPKPNGIIPGSASFLVVGGGGLSARWWGGAGGAGGVVFRESISLPCGTAYVYVGSGAHVQGDNGWYKVVDHNGEDTIFFIEGKAYTAIGGGGADGYSGGSGGGGARGGLGLQPKSTTGGLGEDGHIDGGCKKCGGGPSFKTGISGECVTYSQGGVCNYCLKYKWKGHAITGYGSGGMSPEGTGMEYKNGSNGIVVVRYSIKPQGHRIVTRGVEPLFPKPDNGVKSARINGVEWRYFVEEDGSVTIGCHGDGSIDFPDLWTPAVDEYALEGEVTIPSRIGGKTVKKIGKGAFQYCAEVTKFVVPEGVTHCGSRAFARCMLLQEVSYPKSLQWLGEGQFYRSPKVRMLAFQSSPPKCAYGCCPFKGIRLGNHGSGVVMAAPFALVEQWRTSGPDKLDYYCSDGCHRFRCLGAPSVDESKLGMRTCAGFVGLEMEWPKIDDLKSRQQLLVGRVEDVWRKYDALSNDRKISLVELYALNGTKNGLPANRAIIYVAMMHFNAGEPIRFKYQFDDYGMMMVDDYVAVDFSQQKDAYRNAYSSDSPVVFREDGWHRIAIIAANEVLYGGATYVERGTGYNFGGFFYRRGEKGKWRMFEANPDGSEFRVTKEDARRAIADIERAKREKRR